MPLTQLDSENADRDLTSLVTVLTHTPSAAEHRQCQAFVAFGDGAKDLDGTGGDFEVVVTVGGQTIEPSPQTVTFSTAVRVAIWTNPFPVPSNQEVIIRALSPNAGDSDVDVTVYLFDIPVGSPVDGAIKNATFAADVGSTGYATNIIALAVRKVLDELNLDHLVAVADADDVVDDSIVGKLASTDGDWSKFAKGTDSLQAIRDQGDAAWLTNDSGAGAWTIAFTVDDGTDALESANIRCSKGAESYAATTDVDGQVSFSLDTGTWAIAVTLPGYSFTPTTLVVSADASQTYSMSAVSIASPPSATTTTGVMTVYDEEGSVEESVVVSVQIIEGPGTDGIGYDSTVWAETSSALGVVQFAGIIHGARYKIWRGDSKADAQTFTAPSSGDSFDLAEVIGMG